MPATVRPAYPTSTSPGRTPARCARAPSGAHAIPWPCHGHAVLSVEPQSPAQRAGVRPGDVLVGYAGGRWRGIDDLHRLLVEEQVGISAPLMVIRGGEIFTLDIVPKNHARPPSRCARCGQCRRSAA